MLQWLSWQAANLSCTLPDLVLTALNWVLMLYMVLVYGSISVTIRLGWVLAVKLRLLIFWLRTVLCIEFFIRLIRRFVVVNTRLSLLSIGWLWCNRLRVVLCVVRRIRTRAVDWATRFRSAFASFWPVGSVVL